MSLITRREIEMIEAQAKRDQLDNKKARSVVQEINKNLASSIKNFQR